MTSTSTHQSHNRHKIKHGMTVSECMVRAPYTIGADQTLETAHKLMRSHNIRHLPVLTGGKLVGVVTSRDLYFVETLRGVDPVVVKVEEAMSQDPFVTAPDAPLRDVLNQMVEHKYGCAVVMNGKNVVGIFTSIDAMRILAEAL